MAKSNINGPFSSSLFVLPEATTPESTEFIMFLSFTTLPEERFQFQTNGARMDAQAAE
jgi:hypothetical protein